MTEYWVNHKRMDANDERIEQVRAMIRKEEGGLSAPLTYNRQEVVNSIEDENGNNRWYTCEETSENHYSRRAEIHVYRTANDAFIRTDRNETEEDNLGDLPDF